jgi:hypothetical protein
MSHEGLKRPCIDSTGRQGLTSSKPASAVRHHRAPRASSAAEMIRRGRVEARPSSGGPFENIAEGDRKAKAVNAGNRMLPFTPGGAAQEVDRARLCYKAAPLPLRAGLFHFCVDMQRIFAESTEWKIPWLERVLPNIVTITSAQAERTVFTRFVPAARRGCRHVATLLRAMGVDDRRPDRAGHDRARSRPHEIRSARERCSTSMCILRAPA